MLYFSLDKTVGFKGNYKPPVTIINKEEISRCNFKKLITVFNTQTYHHKICKYCNQIVPPQKHQMTKEELYFEIDTAIIEDKDDSFKKFFNAVDNFCVVFV